jgi:hypothetical protein
MGAPEVHSPKGIVPLGEEAAPASLSPQSTATSSLCSSIKLNVGRAPACAACASPRTECFCRQHFSLFGHKSRPAEIWGLGRCLMVNTGSNTGVRAKKILLWIFSLPHFLDLVYARGRSFLTAPMQVRKPTAVRTPLLPTYSPAIERLERLSPVMACARLPPRSLVLRRITTGPKSCLRLPLTLCPVRHSD